MNLKLVVGNMTLKADSLSAEINGIAKELTEIESKAFIQAVIISRSCFYQAAANGRGMGI